MSTILVDSNVLLDVFTEDPQWYEWSSEQLEALAERHTLAINPIIYAEISIGFHKVETLESALPQGYFARLPLPWEAAFLAGKAFMYYKKRGGHKQSTLPDFFIGAHAAVERLTLLTRDLHRYKTYFPSVKLIVP